MNDEIVEENRRNCDMLLDIGAERMTVQGYPWTFCYTIASGRLLPDFLANLHAESYDRLQVVKSKKRAITDIEE
ncbi:hypothetical protein CHH80_01405 [Bacillus sp. 7504-2]|nr:hypothetical protein CHH80_01405 [Bacillus sp. 7504-2]